MKRLGSFARWIGIGLVAMSVVTELRKPAADRTWRGRILGFVPYDFRAPTVSRFKMAFWNPNDHHLLTARPLGVGWSLNLYELSHRARALLGA